MSTQLLLRMTYLYKDIATWSSQYIYRDDQEDCSNVAYHQYTATPGLLSLGTEKFQTNDTYR
jgi:hypothetical protein